jgi:hypothetical protein
MISYNVGSCQFSLFHPSMIFADKVGAYLSGEGSLNARTRHKCLMATNALAFYSIQGVLKGEVSLYRWPPV